MFSKFSSFAFFGSKMARKAARRQGKRAHQQRRDAGRRLILESLEDRRLLATVYWQGDTSANWSTSSNWLSGNDPSDTDAGDILVFDSTTSNFNVTPGGSGYSSSNNLGTGFNVGSITMNQSLNAFTLGGSSNIDLRAGIASNNTSGTNTINFPFELNGPSGGNNHNISVASGGKLVIGGSISGTD